MQFDQDGHSEVQRQLLITLVHGTWGRGFCPKLQRPNRRPFWFEDGSPFLARLSTELHDIPLKMRPLLWSGANSIFERDKTARVLAESLSAEHAEHPQATQLVIAHSHGGNIALRSLHYLQQRDVSQLDGADSANPLVVTLGTPFIEVHQADFGSRPFYIRVALMLLVAVPLLMLPLLSIGFVRASLGLSPISEVSFPTEASFPLYALASGVCVYLLALMGWWWVVRRGPARQNKLDWLKSATRLGVSVSAQRLLVIRAIDDEPSLTLALGAILSYLAARCITYLLLLYFVLLFGLSFVLTAMRLSSIPPLLPEWTQAALAAGCYAFSIILFGMLMVSRSVHGRELAVSPMECQINTQSAPDAVDLSKIVTLVRRTYVRELRHGIYDYENCPKAISDWVRFRLETN